MVVEQRAAPHVGHPVPVAVRVGRGVDADEPLPRWYQRSKAVRWVALRMPSPSVCSITTTSYGRRPASVKVVASSVRVTLKLFSAPSAWMRGLAGVDRVGVAEAGRLREDEHVVARGLCRRRCGGRSQQCGGKGHRLPSQSHRLSPPTQLRPAVRPRGSASAPPGRPTIPATSSRSRRPGHHHDDSVGERRRHTEVLLDHQQPHPGGREVLDRLDQRLHHGRRQALRRLVHHEQLRVGQQRPADRQHLLLAPGQRRTGHVLALGQPREQLVHARGRPRRLRRRAHDLQVLVDRERLEQPPPLRDVADPGPGELVRRLAAHVLARDPDGAGDAGCPGRARPRAPCTAWTCPCRCGRSARPARRPSSATRPASTCAAP